MKKKESKVILLGWMSSRSETLEKIERISDSMSLASNQGYCRVLSSGDDCRQQTGLHHRLAHLLFCISVHRCIFLWKASRLSTQTTKCQESD